jgi:predicted O-methyltransferase YrrM
MSDKTWTLSDDLARYLLEHSPPEDPFLKDLKDAALAEEIPAIWIAHEQAMLMQIVLRLARAKDVVEVGTLAGYSAIAMARGLSTGGLVKTIEIEPRHAAFAEKWIARSNVADRVRVLQGEATEVLATLDADSADAVFIDADKENYAIYLDEAARILRSGGVLMVDNAFRDGRVLEEDVDGGTRAIKASNDRLAADDDFQAVIVPIADGLWLGVRT